MRVVFCRTRTRWPYTPTRPLVTEIDSIACFLRSVAKRGLFSLSEGKCTETEVYRGACRCFSDASFKPFRSFAGAKPPQKTRRLGDVATPLGTIFAPQNHPAAGGSSSDGTPVACRPTIFLARPTGKRHAKTARNSTEARLMDEHRTNTSKHRKNTSDRSCALCRERAPVCPCLRGP